MKKYRFGVMLQSSELNLGQRKTTMIVRDNLYRRPILVKVQSEFQGFFRKVIKDQSKIVFQVIFHINGDFNNSRG